MRILGSSAFYDMIGPPGPQGDQGPIGDVTPAAEAARTAAETAAGQAQTAASTAANNAVALAQIALDGIAQGVEEDADRAEAAAVNAAAQVVTEVQPMIDAAADAAVDIALPPAVEAAVADAAPAAADAIRAEVAADADRAEAAAEAMDGVVDVITTLGIDSTSGAPEVSLSGGYHVDARPIPRDGVITGVRVYRASAGNARIHVMTKSGVEGVISEGDVFTTRVSHTFNDLPVGWSELEAEIEVNAGEYLAVLTSNIGGVEGGSWPGGVVGVSGTTHPFTITTTAPPAAVAAIQWSVFLPGEFPVVRDEVNRLSGDMAATTGALSDIEAAISPLVTNTYGVGASSVEDTTDAVAATSGQHASAVMIDTPCRLRRIRFHRATEGNHRTQIMTRDGAGLMTMRKSLTLSGLAAGYHDVEVDEELLPGDYLAALTLGHLGRPGATWDGGMYWATGSSHPWTDPDTGSPPDVPMLVEWVIETPGKVEQLDTRVSALEAAPPSESSLSPGTPQSFAPQLIADSLAVPSRLFGRSTGFVASAGWRNYDTPFQDQTRRLPNGAKVSLKHTSRDQRTFWYAINGSSQIWTGTPDNFVGQTGNVMTLPAGCAVRTYTIDATMVAVEVVAGSPTFDTMAEPAYTHTFGFLGQSHDNLAYVGGAIGGFADGIRDGGWMQAALDINPAWVNLGYGSSAVFLSTKGDDGNWWVDDSGGTLADGPRLTAVLATIDAAVAEGKPLPSAIFVGGPGDAQEAQMGAGGKTVEQLRDGYLHIWDAVRAKCPDAAFMISVHPLNDRDANHKGAIATRRAMLAARDARTWCHPGAERYDQPRVLGEIHTTDMGHYRHGVRCARAYANAVHGQSNRLGPRITGAVLSADALAVTVTLDRAFSTTGTRLPEPDMAGGRRSGPMPYGLAAIDATSGAVIPLLYGEQSGAASVTLVSETSLSNALIATPPGTGIVDFRLGALIGDMTFHAGYAMMPMQASIVTPAVP